MKIVLIGAGNVAWHLAPALKKQGHEIIAIFSRTKKSADALAKKVRSNAVSKIEDIPPTADLYILALQDKAIGEVARSLSFIPKNIVHTSGSVPVTVFPRKFRNTGVFYPLQTFTKNRKVNFKEIPLLIESNDPKTKKLLLNLANSISEQVHFITSEKRKKIHLAAVFANNFVNYLYSIASDILKDNQLPFDLLKPLILETAMKIRENSPEKIQTGPARRNDTQVIQSHLKLLNRHKEKKAIYALLSKSLIHKFSTKR